MSSIKKCAKCEKTVYPLEEIKCLEKIWHKACFKCQVCNMTLSMRNYKGFDKLPYCEAHVPKAKATIVVDTPEMKRLAENSKLQSNVKYHADFEASKGKFTTVVDDPESLRLKANNQIISNVSYHGIVEQKAEQEKKRSLVGQENDGPIVKQVEGPNKNEANLASNKREHHQQETHYVEKNGGSKSHHTSAAHSTDYRKYSSSSNHEQQYEQRHPSGRVSTSSTGSYTSQSSYSQQNAIQGRSVPPSSAPPYQSPPPSSYGQQHMSSGYSSHQQQQYNPPPQQYRQQPQQQRMAPQQQQYHPAQQPQQYSQHQYQQHPMGYRQPPQQSSYVHQPVQPPQPQPQRAISRCYKAMYDYEAQDSDEVSFNDGDIIINCTHIDEGWMTGTVHRTGKFGMLPANYVEAVNL